jgi:hypothetical protein
MLMFTSKSRAYPDEEAPGLTSKHQTASDKHSNLLQTFVNYGREKFYIIGPVYDSECIFKLTENKTS